ncbi:glutathione S-transferase theta-1-like [Strongylocentrotus purpuratus]|uniref:GST N-terminal domain-containing protein n=1 Tax=Strongylocentrotus purpuratus TaxID=7668 RepID=A0A7M7N3W6_STRPU|nr:glutathione S-transferase theta-1-like [Strongylocentrotus purpuratus]
MSVKIFYDVLSHPARSVLMFVRANKIPYTPCPIAIRKSEHQSKEYAAVSPMMKIPAMQDGEFKLTERYGSTTLPGAGDTCAPKILVIFPRMTGTPPDPAALAPDIQRMEETLDNLEKHFLQEKPFLCGYDISIADLFGVNEFVAAFDLVIQVEPCGYGTLDRRPKLKAWIGRVREHVQPEIFDDVSQLMYRLAKAKQKL